MAQDINRVDISTEMKSDDYLLASIGGKLRRVKVDNATGITKEINEKIENMIGSDEFNTTSDYATGDYVIYENVLYKFTTNKPAGPWDASVVEVASIEAEIRALKTSIEVQKKIVSDEFNTAIDYATGDYVIYENTLYKFTSDKSAGEWDQSLVIATTVDTELGDLKGSVDELNSKLDVINLASEVSLTEKFQWNNEPNIKKSGKIITLSVALKSTELTSLKDITAVNIPEKYLSSLPVLLHCVTVVDGVSRQCYITKAMNGIRFGGYGANANYTSGSEIFISGSWHVDS